MSKARLMAAAMAVGVATGLTSCGASTDAGQADVASVTVEVSSTTLLSGNSATATATVIGKLGPDSHASVEWRSDAPSVADIAPQGLSAQITGKNPGTAHIVASSGGQSGSATITVTNIPVASVLIPDRVASIGVGATKQLTALARDAGGGGLTGRQIVWSSLTPTIASVDGTGLVTARTLGTVQIVAACETKSDTAAITVLPGAVANIAISPPSLDLIAGDTSHFQVVLTDAANDVLSGRTIVWASSDTTVAIVSSAAATNAIGTIHAVAKGGPVSVTASSEGKSASAAVQVRPVPQVPVASVTMAPPTLAVAVGASAGVTATPRDSLGNALVGRTLSWVSADPTIASVAATGSSATISGLKVGTTTVTATTDDGIRGSTAVTVQPLVSYQLTVTLGFNWITSSGSVTSSPTGINCVLTNTAHSGTCTATFQSGTIVSLSASPNPAIAYRLLSWSGACSGFSVPPSFSTPACAFTMTGNQNVTGIFDRMRYPVTVNITGSGTVMSTESGLCSSSSCVFLEPYGEGVSYIPTPATNWLFASWSGACSGSASCGFVISGPQTIGATFQPKP